MVECASVQVGDYLAGEVLNFLQFLMFFADMLDHSVKQCRILPDTRDDIRREGISVCQST